MNDYIFMSLFWGFGGLVNGIAGFGSALIATPLATMFVDISLVIPAGTIIALSMNSQMGITFRKYADWNRIWPLIIGSIPGTITGVVLMKKLPGDYLKLAMGFFLIIYASWSLLYEGRFRKIVSKHWGFVAGFCSSALELPWEWAVPQPSYTAL